MANLGGMRDYELRVPRLLDHAARERGGREIVTRRAHGRTTRTSWAVSRMTRAVLPCTATGKLLKTALHERYGRVAPEG